MGSPARTRRCPRVPERTREDPRVPERTREDPRGPESTREDPRVPESTREYPDSTLAVPDSTRQYPRVTKTRAGGRRSADTLPCCAGRGRRTGEAVVRCRSVGHPRARSAGCPPSQPLILCGPHSRKQGAAHARNADRFTATTRAIAAPNAAGAQVRVRSYEHSCAPRRPVWAARAGGRACGKPHLLR